MTSQQIFDRFISHWTHESYPPIPETEDSLATAQNKLGIFFPIAYKLFLKNYGSCGTISNLLDSIVDAGLDVRDLSEIYSLSDVVEFTEQRRINYGLPLNLIAIGSDCSGNNFCFQEKDCSERNINDAEIWFYDYATTNLNKEAESFIDWVNNLSRIEPITYQK